MNTYTFRAWALWFGSGPVAGALPPPPKARRLLCYHNFDTEVIGMSQRVFHLLVSWIEALSACSDHCRAMGCRVREVTEVLGKMDVARAKPKPRPGGKPPV